MVRHAIDGMHLKKNVFGNTIGLLLETSSKRKDTLKSCQNLVAMKIREDLHLVDKRMAYMNFVGVLPAAHRGVYPRW
jgi:hypothetical protein